MTDTVVASSSKTSTISLPATKPRALAVNVTRCVPSTTDSSLPLMLNVTKSWEIGIITGIWIVTSPGMSLASITVNATELSEFRVTVADEDPPFSLMDAWSIINVSTGGTAESTTSLPPPPR